MAVSPASDHSVGNGPWNIHLPHEHQTHVQCATAETGTITDLSWCGSSTPPPLDVARPQAACPTPLASFSIEDDSDLVMDTSREVLVFAPCVFTDAMDERKACVGTIDDHIAKPSPIRNGGGWRDTRRTRKL